MASPKVIVFGPTGGVGSATAITASSLGATIVLAMRDTKKPIPNLSEESGKFERIYADLTIPSSVEEAVKTSGAKHAFIYLAHGSKDHMKATIQALKSAGIEFVVFLSSYTVRGKLEAIEAAELIPFIHAQVEINLREIFGEGGYVAARPGYFASNNLQYKKGIHDGEVKMYKPDGTVDNIVPADIGAVCGKILVEGVPKDGVREVFLYGPKLISPREIVGILAKMVGKEPKIVELDEDAAYKMFVGQFGDGFAKYMTRRMKESVQLGGNRVFGYEVGEGHLSNVEKYSGRKATTFEEWAEKNKGLFLS